MTEYIAKCNEVEGIGGKTILVPDYIDTNKKIVRCCDCTYYAKDEFGNYCTLFDFEDVFDMDDMFCAWGNRKDDNNA